MQAHHTIVLEEQFTYQASQSLRGLKFSNKMIGLQTLECVKLIDLLPVKHQQRTIST